MAPYTRGKKRDKLTYVSVYQGLLYGFKTKDFSALAGISESDLSTKLGHLLGAFVVPPGSIRVLGANLPKPARVTKKIVNAAVGSQQSVSTFCGYQNLATAMADGWNVTTQRKGVSLRPETSTKNSLTAIAQLSDGSLYCYAMNKVDFQSYGATLGLQSATNLGSISDLERAKLVAGSTIPKPGKAVIEVAGGAGGTFQSYYSTASKDGATTGGFSILTDEVVFAEAV